MPRLGPKRPPPGCPPIHITLPSPADHHLLPSAALAITAICTSRKLHMLAIAERFADSPPTIRLVQVRGNDQLHPVATLRAPASAPAAEFTALSFSANGRYLAALVGAPTPTLLVLDWADSDAGTTIATVPLPRRFPHVTYSPVRDDFLLVHAPKTTIAVAISTPQPDVARVSAPLTTTLPADVTAVAWNGADHLLAGHEDGSLSVVTLSVAPVSLVLAEHASLSSEESLTQEDGTATDVETGGVEPESSNVIKPLLGGKVRGDSLTAHVTPLPTKLASTGAVTALALNKLQVLAVREGDLTQAQVLARPTPEKLAEAATEEQAARGTTNMSSDADVDADAETSTRTTSTTNVVAPVPWSEPMRQVHFGSQVLSLTVGGPDSQLVVAVGTEGLEALDLSSSMDTPRSLGLSHRRGDTIVNTIPVQDGGALTLSQAGILQTWGPGTSTTSLTAGPRLALEVGAVTSFVTVPVKGPGALIAVGSRDGTLRLVATSSSTSGPQLVGRLRLSTTAAVARIAASPTGHAVACLLSDARLFMVTLHLDPAKGGHWEPSVAGWIALDEATGVANLACPARTDPPVLNVAPAQTTKTRKAPVKVVALAWASPGKSPSAGSGAGCVAVGDGGEIWSIGLPAAVASVPRTGRDLKFVAKQVLVRRVSLTHRVSAGCTVVKDGVPGLALVLEGGALATFTLPASSSAWITTNVHVDPKDAAKAAAEAEKDRLRDKPHPVTVVVPAGELVGSVTSWSPLTANDPRVLLTTDMGYVAVLGLDALAGSALVHPSSLLGWQGAFSAAFLSPGALLSGAKNGNLVLSQVAGYTPTAPAAGAALPDKPVPAATSGAVVDVADATEEPDAIQAYQRALDEAASKVAEPKKQSVRNQIAGIRQELAELLARNETVGEDEKLVGDECFVHTGLLSKLEADMETEGNRMRAQRDAEALDREVIRDRIVTTCWDGLKTKPAVVVGMAGGGKVGVQNLAVGADSASTHLARKVALLRRCELTLEKKGLLGRTRRSARLRTVASPPAPEGLETSGGGGGEAKDADEKKEKKASDSGDGKDGEKGGDANEEEEVEMFPKEDSEMAAAGLTKSAGGSAQLLLSRRDKQDEEIESLLYAPTDLLSRSRRVMQVYLLSLQWTTICCLFNKEWDAAVSDKQSELEKISECTNRFKAVLHELARLGMGQEKAHNVSSLPVVVADPNPESMLTVRDEDIQVEKVLTRAERAAEEKRLAEEAARAAAMAQDNAAERALKQMLGGTLERVEEEDASLVLIKPAFMDEVPDPDKWSDEQKAAAAAYAKREIAVQEEKEKRAMGFEAELRTLTQTAQSASGRIDARVHALRGVRVDTEFMLAVIARRMEQLAATADALLQYGPDQTQAVEARVAHTSATYAAAAEQTASVRDSFDHKSLETLLAEDRAVERSVKKELAEMCGDGIAPVLALYRRREWSHAPPPPPASRTATGTAGTGQGSRGQPGSRAHRGSHAGGGPAGPSVQGSHASLGLAGNSSDALESATSLGSLVTTPVFMEKCEKLGVHPDAPGPTWGNGDPFPDAGAIPVPPQSLVPLRPDEFPAEVLEEVPGVFDYVVRARNVKANLELRLERAHKAAAAHAVVLRRLEYAEAQAHQGMVSALQARDVFVAERDALQWDLSLPLLLRQGQVDFAAGFEPAGDSASLPEAVVIPVHDIIHVNDAIHGEGAKKVEILTAIKDFKRGIYDLEWHNRRLELEGHDLKERTREYQLLRVTKELQAGLAAVRTGNLSMKGGSENLEQMMKHSATLAAKRMEEKTRIVAQLSRAAKERQQANKKLENHMEEMEKLVERESRILQSSTLRDPGKDSLVSHKMRLLVTKARLRDLAAEQEEEIRILQTEIARLQSRTFPTFVSVVHDD